MDRTTGAGRIDIGGGRWGYRDRNLALGQAGTIVNAEAMNGLQEEVLSAIEGGGVVPSAADRAQLWQAVRRLAGGNVASLSANATLTLDQAGLVQVSAAAGNVTLTLPAANGLAGRPVRFNFIRTDSTANTLTIQRAGADTIEGGTSVTLGVGGRLLLVSDGATAWRVAGEAATGRSYGASGWQRLPGGLIVQWGTFTTSASTDIFVNFPVAFPTACWSLVCGHLSVNANSPVALGANGFPATTGFAAAGYSATARSAISACYLALGA